MSLSVCLAALRAAKMECSDPIEVAEYESWFYRGYKEGDVHNLLTELKAAKWTSNEVAELAGYLEVARELMRGQLVTATAPRRERLKF